MREFVSSIFILSSIICLAQRPIYDFVSYNKTLSVPKELNSERSAVIFSVPDIEKKGFIQIGNYEKILNQAHKGFITMGIDPIFYLQDINLIASKSARDSYVELFNQRRIKNVIFLTQTKDSFEVIIAPYSGDQKMILQDSDVFYIKSDDLYSLLLNLGREIRRADYEKLNFLIPEKPGYIGGVSIVEKTLLKNYPGILRRSKLAVERFAQLDTSNISDPQIAEKVKNHNKSIEEKNQQLEKIMESYPYEYELINPMNDDELKRNRYQFLLRSVTSTVETVKRMLDYEVVPGETGFVSVIPVMPDQTRVKTIPRDAIVYKFYVRQNISKNVHVGEWDADVTWEDALRNMIGNLTQELRVKN